MSETLPTTEVNSKIDLTLTKEDVLTVLMHEKEEELNNELEVLIKKREVVKEEIKDLIKSTEAAVIKKYKGDVVHSLFYNDYNNCIRFSFYNIGRLENLKNPKTAKDKMYSEQCYSFSFGKNIEIGKVVKNDGFEGVITKNVSSSSFPASIKSAIGKLDKLQAKSIKLKIEIADFQYQLLILDTDRSIKAKLIKQIVKTTDFKLLLGEQYYESWLIEHVKDL